MSNPSLGTIACPTCNEPGADVRQTKRRGARLYWQCPECGLNQPTGAKIQAQLWHNTAWKDGAQPIRPGNVTDAPAPEPKKEAEPLAEFDPNEPEEPTEPQPSAKRPAKPSPGKAVGVLLLGALGLGVVLAAN